MGLAGFLRGTDPFHWSIALSAVPALHGVSFELVRQRVLPAMRAEGLARVTATIARATGSTLAARELSAAALMASLAWTLFSFYPHLAADAWARGEYDNADPRTKDKSKSRFYAAHVNAMEDFPRFAAAVLAALVLLSNADASASELADVAALSWAYVGLRMCHWACYAVNMPVLRSLSFVMGFHTTLRIIGTAVFR